jgi:LPXTG-motif cell wall-anchored protein
MAQVSLETENEAESEDNAMDFSVENSGNYANQCTPAVQFGNTGNFNNAPSFQQYASKADDFEPGGIEFAVEPGLAVECDQEVQQAAAASSATKAEERKAQENRPEEKKATPAPASTPKADVKAGATEAPKAQAPKVEAPKAEAKASGTEAKAAPKAEQTKELPKTGGGILPIAGIAGALLVGGGLLIRKLAG